METKAIEILINPNDIINEKIYSEELFNLYLQNRVKSISDDPKFLNILNEWLENPEVPETKSGGVVTAITGKVDGKLSGQLFIIEY